MLNFLKAKGQGIVEYALIIVMIVLLVFAVILLLGPTISNVFSNISNSLSY